FRDVATPLLDLTGVMRADLLAGEILLLEQEQRLPARLAPRNGHTATRKLSSVEVEYSPLRNGSLASTSRARSRVVGTPSRCVSRSARRARAIAASRSESHTTSLATSEA